MDRNDRHHIDYKAKGGSVHFAVKDPCEELTNYFMQCLQRLHDAGRGKNPVIVNVNANGDFLNSNDSTKFKRITQTIVNELRSEGYMVSCGGPMWREVRPFLDAHGRISVKGLMDKHIAVGVLEKQLFREKAIMRCMFAPRTITDLDLIATQSGIAKVEGLVDEPPQEYKYEDVNAVPFGVNLQQSGSGRGRKVKPKMHVPNWDGQPTVSYQPTLVSDDRFFWILIDHGSRDEMKEDDPMMHLSGLCDHCSVSAILDMREYPDQRGCPNCSANYTLNSFGGYTDDSDMKLRIFLAHKTMTIYESDEDWVSFDPNTQLKEFMKMAIRTFINSPLGKAVSSIWFL